MRKACRFCLAASLFGLTLAILLLSGAPQASARPPKLPKMPKMKMPKMPKMKMPKMPKAKMSKTAKLRMPKPKLPKGFKSPKPHVQKLAKKNVSPHNAAGRRMPEPQKKSNAQLAQALRALKSSHATLGKGDHDYGGHRANAERDVGKAARSLEAALGMQGDKGKKASAPRKHDPWHPEAQAKSNAQIQAQIRALQQGIAVLKKGDRDYGGDRVQSIRDMQAAVSQLQKALKFAKSK